VNPDKFCQNCGMPLNKDPRGDGTNADGTTSLHYCSYCYQSGAFTLPQITLPEMKARVKGKLKEMGFPGFFAGMFTWKLGKLERWTLKPE
jgi:hypothetical protein